MGLFGGLFSSESRSETLSTGLNNIEGDGDSLMRSSINLSGVTVGKKGKLDLHLSDYGAIEAGTRTAREAIGFASSAASGAQDFAQAAQSSAEDFAMGSQAVAGQAVNSALSLVRDSTKTELEGGIDKLFNLGMVALVVVGAVMIWKG